MGGGDDGGVVGDACCHAHLLLFLLTTNENDLHSRTQEGKREGWWLRYSMKLQTT